MNLDELQSVRDRERQTDKLQQLRESFYTDAGEFIEQLRAERDRAAAEADDPWDSPEAMQLNDKIESATQLVEDIYERRIGKLVKAASLDAAGLAADAEGMTAEEEELFEALVADIEHHRNHVVDIVGGGHIAEGDDSETPDDGPSDQTPADDSDHADAPQPPPEATGEVEESPTTQPAPDTTAADAMGAGGGAPPVDETAHESDPDPPVRNDGGTTRQVAGDNPAPPAGAETDPSADTPGRNEDDGGVEASDPERATDEDFGRDRVLVTEDVDTFLGFDQRDYDLSASDVVTLPAPNAEILVDRDAARRL